MMAYTQMTSLHYSSVDDAAAILIHLSKGALMAKIDLVCYQEN